MNILWRNCTHFKRFFKAGNNKKQAILVFLPSLSYLNKKAQNFSLAKTLINLHYMWQPHLFLSVTNHRVFLPITISLLKRDGASLFTLSPLLHPLYNMLGTDRGLIQGVCSFKPKLEKIDEFTAFHIFSMWKVSWINLRRTFCGNNFRKLAQNLRKSQKFFSAKVSSFVKVVQPTT